MATTVETLQIEMKDTLERVEGVEVLSASSKENALFLQFRAKHENPWLKTLFDVLKNVSGMELFFGKKYFIHDDGKMYFAWVMILEHEDIEAAVYEIRALVLESLGLAAKRSTMEERNFGTVKLPYSTKGWQEKKNRRVRKPNVQVG